MSAVQPTARDVPARRRDWEQSRRRILDAAQQLFADRGYRGTSTREIAAAAGLSEPTLYRHFPVKVELFEEAVLTPVKAFLEAFVQRRRDRPVGSRQTAVSVREFYEELLDELGDRSPLLIALAAAVAFRETDADLSELTDTIARLFDGMEDVFRAEAGVRGFTIDPGIGPRLMVGIALSVSLHGAWLFPGTNRPNRGQLVSEMVKLTTWGLEGKREESNINVVSVRRP